MSYHALLGFLRHCAGSCAEIVTLLPPQPNHMEINAYQSCPCHFEKKIKFCCGKDIVADLTQVTNLTEARQGLGALEHIDRLVKRHGPKDCLLTLKTRVLLHAGNIEEAQQANDAVLEKSPNEPIPLAHQAMIMALSGEPPQDVIERLQNALNAIGQTYPAMMSGVVRTVAHYLFVTGLHHACRAHLAFCARLRGGHDQDTVGLLMASVRAAGPRALLAFDPDLPSADDADQTAARYLKPMHQAVSRAQFRLALRIAQKMADEQPSSVAAIKCCAILCGYLGRIPQAAEYWRQLGDRQPDDDAGVDAHGMALALSPVQFGPEPSSVIVTFELEDHRRFLEIAADVNTLSEVDPQDLREEDLAEEEDQEAENVPPRSAFVELVRPLPDDIENMSLDQMSAAIGRLLLWGKQTDRPARLQWHTLEDDTFAQRRSHLEETFSGLLKFIDQRSLGPRRDRLSALLSLNWVIPGNLTRAKHDQLLQDHFRMVFLEQIPDIPVEYLGGKTLAQAAPDGGQRRPVLAILESLRDIGTAFSIEPQWVDQLQQQLGVQPLPEATVPPDRHVAALGPWGLRRLQIATLSAEQLKQLANSALWYYDLALLRRAGPALLSSPDVEDSIAHGLLSALIHSAITFDEAMHWVREARRRAAASGQSQGKWLAEEFELRLKFGETEKLGSLLEEIRSRHHQEQDVLRHLAHVLHEYGLIRPDGEIAPAPESEADEAGAQQQLWQPGQAEPTPAASGSQANPSKLWLPGQG